MKSDTGHMWYLFYIVFYPLLDLVRLHNELLTIPDDVVTEVPSGCTDGSFILVMFNLC